jgi:hypothetical protein
MLDLPVDLTGRQVQESGREPGEQGFELKPFFNCHFGAFELCDLRSQLLVRHSQLVRTRLRPPFERIAGI